MTHMPLNQWESATAGAHHQAGELEVAFPAGGSSSGHGTQSAGMAPQVCALNDAAWPQDREGRDGARLAIRLYWMMRQGWDYQG